MVTATKKTLRDVTGQDSGIVVMGKEVYAVNWASEAPDGGVPVVSPVGTPISMSAPEGFQILSEEHVEDVRERLPGVIYATGKNEEGVPQIKAENMEVKYDAYNQIPALWGFDLGQGACVRRDGRGKMVPTPGAVYRVRFGEHEAVVIAPDGWE